MWNKHTLLNLACANRDPETIKVILDAGADSNLVYDGPIRADPLANLSWSPKIHIHAKGPGQRGYTALFAPANGGDVRVGGGLWCIDVTFDRSDAEPLNQAYVLRILIRYQLLRRLSIVHYPACSIPNMQSVCSNHDANCGS
jgi:hypothetical protein